VVESPAAFSNREAAFAAEKRPASTPNRSHTKRFKARMAMDASKSPRRHRASHGALHTRPQTEAKGLHWRAMR